MRLFYNCTEITIKYKNAIKIDISNAWALG
jgi:hypothetical protein